MQNTINQESLEDGTHALPVQAKEPDRSTKCVNQALNEGIDCLANH